MKLKGTATITKWLIQDDGSLVETETIIEDNIINKRAINEVFSAQGGGVFNNGLKIALSQKNTTANFEEQTLSQITAVGDPNSYTFTVRTATEPSTLVYTNRFSPPPNNRTINSVGIVSGTSLSNDSNANTTRNSYTYLLLSSPVVQSSVEILDISYKIFIGWEDNNVPIGFQLYTESKFFGQTISNTSQGFRDIPFFNTMIGYLLSPYSGYETYVQGFFSYFGSLTSGTVRPLSEGNTLQDIEKRTPIDNRYGVEYSWARSYSSWNRDVLSKYATGRCVRGFLASQWSYTNASLGVFKDVINYDKLYASEILLKKSSNLSNVWSHSKDSTLPMYDKNQLANSSWKPEITEQTNTPDFQSTYYLRVTKSGGAGTGEYKLYKSSFQGYLNYSNNTAPSGDLFWHINANSAYQDETNDEFIWDHRWVYEWSKSLGVYEFATFRRKAGIAVVKVTDRAVTETVRFPLKEFTVLGTLINDIDVDPQNSFIYAATESGLFRLNATTKAITTLSTDACASVCVGNAGQVFAIFRDGEGNGRLSSSIGANWTTALDLEGATVNWNNVWRVWIDPQSTQYNLMVYEGSIPKHFFQLVSNTSTVNDNSNKIHWWNNNDKFIKTDTFNNNVTTPTSSAWLSYCQHELFVLPNNSCVSVTNGLWVYPGRRQDANTVSTPKGAFRAPTMTHLERGGSVPIDIKNDAAASSVGWQSFTVKTGVGIRLGWNENATNLLNSYQTGLAVGNSGEYLFGEHSSTPFYSKKFDGSLCCVYNGKPTSNVTSYSLDLVMGMYVNDGDRDANENKIPNFFKITIDETDNTQNTTLNYEKDKSLLYKNFQAVAFESTFIYYPCNFIKVGSGQMMFMAPPKDWYRNYATNSKLTEPIIPTSPFTIGERYTSGGIGIVNLFRKPLEDMDDSWVASYGWNGTSWVEGEAAGKPLHTTTEALIDGLQINWVDLAPTNTRDLIKDQYYNFIKITEPNTIFVEENMPNLVGSNHFWLRAFGNNTLTGTVPSTTPLRVYVNEAPKGQNANNLFLGLPPDEEDHHFEATINGNKVQVLVNTSTTPAPGTIHITSVTQGELYFAPEDSGQPYTFKYNWVKKYHPTELL